MIENVSVNIQKGNVFVELPKCAIAMIFCLIKFYKLSGKINTDFCSQDYEKIYDSNQQREAAFSAEQQRATFFAV